MSGIRNRSKESHVWEHFRKEGEFVKCIKCQKKLKNCGNTTNLSEHLKRVHAITHRTTNVANDNIDDPDDPGAPQSSSQSQAPGTSSQSLTRRPIPPQSLTRRPIPPFFASGTRDITVTERNALDLTVLKMVCKDFQPLSFVENEGFKLFSQKLQETVLRGNGQTQVPYQTPNRKFLTKNLLPTEYKKNFLILQEKLNAVQYVAITTDGWTSDSPKSYLTVTCHFIHDNSLESYVLATRELPTRHTAENVALKIKEIIEEFNITAKVVAIVTDNASNMKKCVTDCLQKPHFPCTAHTLNLVVQNSVDESPTLKSTIKKCRKIVAHFKQSHIATELLKQCQERLNMPVLKLKQDVETRWNSVQKMFERLVSTRRALTMAMAELPNSPDLLSHDEWTVMEDSVNLLRVFIQATEQLSGEKYPTLAMVIPIVRGIQSSIMACDFANEHSRTFKKRLIENIGERFGNIERNKLSSTATFIDPRFKKIGFGNETNANTAEQNVLREMAAFDLFSRFEAETDCTDRTPEPRDAGPSEPEQPVLANNTPLLWSRFEEKKRMAQSNNRTADMVIEMRHFMASKVIDRTESPLQFYIQNRNVFPTLYNLNLKYACIPATSVPSERVFSKTGQLTNNRRNRLAPANLDKIIFLNSFYSMEK